MKLLLAPIILLVLSTAHGDERMADVAAYVNAVWFAEEFNEHCPDSPIEVPVSESQLRRVLVLADGGNFVDVVAKDPNIPDLNFRDGMKDIARDSTAEGCDSETAAMLRARVESVLVVPAVVAELLRDSSVSQ
jgi:hypothetical protein